ncbi:MAG: histidine kinase [Hyphomicrobium sp.]|jgi:two-component system sensor histidine kinase UhpB
MRDVVSIQRAPARKRPMDLKRSLIVRIAIVASLCSALVTAFALIETHQEARRHGATTADIVAKQLELQLLRINAGFDLSNRFPDWDTVLSNGSASGQCVSFYDERGEMRRSNCVGVGPSEEQAPAWFQKLSALFFSPGDPVARDVAHKGTTYGRVVVTSAPEAVVARIWREIKHPLILTFLTVASLAISVYIALARALAPTQDVIAGLNKLASGDLSYRLPDFNLAELQRISEVVNQLAQKIETVLAEQSELSARLVDTQEDERRHLARELHDEFGQNLAAISALAASIERTAEEQCQELRGEARSLAHISMSMMQSLRGTLLRLRPADFEKFGLAESLRQLVDVWSASRRRQTRFELEIPARLDLPDNAAIHIYRIAQEGLTNAAKHAGASTVRLRVEPIAMPEQHAEDARGIRLTIEDDGRGRDAHDAEPAGGRGLINMRERVAALGGTIAFDDRAGAGLIVRVVVPVVAQEASADAAQRH